MTKKKSPFTAVRIMDGEERKILHDLRIAMRDEKTHVVPNSRDVVIKCLEIVHNQLFQENGANTRNPLYAHIVRVDTNKPSDTHF